MTDKITIERETLERTIDALLDLPLRADREVIAEALRAALAQPAEPVAWEVWVPPDSGYLIDSLDDPQYVDDMTNIEGVQVTPLVYAAPAAVPPGMVLVPTHLTVDQLERFVGHGLCCGTEPITEAVIDAGHRWHRLLERIAASGDKT